MMNRVLVSLCFGSVALAGQVKTECPDSLANFFSNDMYQNQITQTLYYNEYVFQTKIEPTCQLTIAYGGETHDLGDTFTVSIHSGSRYRMTGPYEVRLGDSPLFYPFYLKFNGTINSDFAFHSHMKYSPKDKTHPVQMKSAEFKKGPSSGNVFFGAFVHDTFIRFAEQLNESITTDFYKILTSPNFISEFNGLLESHTSILKGDKSSYLSDNN